METLPMCPDSPINNDVYCMDHQGSTTTSATATTCRSQAASASASALSMSGLPVAEADTVPHPCNGNHRAIDSDNDNNNNNVTDQEMVHGTAENDEEDELVTILEEYGVELDDTDVDQSIQNLLVLKAALQEAVHRRSGTKDQARSPGFFTVLQANANSNDDDDDRPWRRASRLPDYETLDLKHHPTTNGRSQPQRVPISSPAFALTCCELVEELFRIRLAWSEEQAANVTLLDDQGNFQESCNDDDDNDNNKYCSCIINWAHTDKMILYTLVNQGLEQLMIQEATECLTNQILPNDEAVMTWNTSYYNNNNNNNNNDHGATTADTTTAATITSIAPNTITTTTATTTTPIRLLQSRDDFMATLVKYCLLAQTSIQISTCYLFPHDPAHRYVLLDVLPHILQNNPQVKVQVLLDVMTIESAILKSGFYNKRNDWGFYSTKRATNKSFSLDEEDKEQEEEEEEEEITAESFFQHLPSTAPPPSEASQKAWTSPLAFLQYLLQVADLPEHQGRYQIQWWCARDAEYKYRIKNHAKCTVIDRQVAIFGGSNLVPTVQAARSDLDLLVVGPTAAQVAETVDLLWNAIEGEQVSALVDADAQQLASATTSSTTNAAPSAPTITTTIDTISSPLQVAMDSESWSDSSSQVQFVRSQPSSKGEDSILRVVLEAISQAKESVIVCMGHCNIPLPFTWAVRDAIQRGVQVQILVNSLYSCDLRGGQRDLFLSLSTLLQEAPGVQVFATASFELRRAQATNTPPPLHARAEKYPRPPFIHAKYVVVDNAWSTVGSWNLWTRGAFFELEHEALVWSTSFAQGLTQRFESERQAHAIEITTPQMASDPAAGFCPIGCAICKGFGPFF